MLAIVVRLHTLKGKASDTPFACAVAHSSRHGAGTERWCPR